MVENIDKGSDYLVKLIEDKDEQKLEKVASVFSDLYSELSSIGIDFYNITEYIIALSKSFEWQIDSLTTLGFFVIFFALFLVLPKKLTRACGFSEPC